MTSDGRPTPEQLLEQMEHEERHQRQGRLKVFLGYSSGVGKSEQMFNEGRRRHERGQKANVERLVGLAEGIDVRIFPH